MKLQYMYVSLYMYVGQDVFMHNVTGKSLKYIKHVHIYVHVHLHIQGWMEVNIILRM